MNSQERYNMEAAEAFKDYKRRLEANRLSFGKNGAPPPTLAQQRCGSDVSTNSGASIVNGGKPTSSVTDAGSAKILNKYDQIKD